jgi:hypothetical protein
VSFFGSLKKIKLKKIVATVKKTISDASTVAAGVGSGGIAGGLASLGTLSKKVPTALSPTTVYGSDQAAQAAAAANASNTAPAPDQGSSMMPWLLIGGGILLLVLLSRR